MLGKQQSSERWKQLRALVCEWDPIGVTDDPTRPGDEYDCLLGEILARLESRAPRADLSRLLRNQLREHFGLSELPPDVDDFAGSLQQWFETSWASAADRGSADV